MRSIGRLRHKVELVAPSRASDGALGYTTVDTSIATVYANIKDASGSEKFRYQHLEQELTHSILIRYNTKVEQGRYFKYGERKFYIMAVVDPTERKEWMRCLCREGGLT